MVYTPPQNTVVALPEGATSMRSASIANTNSVAAKQNELNQMAGSRRRKSRRFRGGATTGTNTTNTTNQTIPVPVVAVPFKETGGGQNTTSSNVTKSTQVGAAENANSKYDNLVGTKVKTGGKKRSTFKGGRHVHWGCMSGGKFMSGCKYMSGSKYTKRRRNKSTKTRKYRKYRK